MLQMDCPKCKGEIRSLLLADLSTVECHQCKEIIPVKDVFITTKHFTIHRDDFVNRNFRFQKLLREVEKELHLMANNKEASTKSKESLNQFYSSLKELLVGARDSYRLELPCDLSVEVNEKDRKMKGRLVNLSTSGGSIEFLQLDKAPRNKSELKIVFSLPELSGNLCIQAKVVWTKEQIKNDGTLTAISGITFTAIDEKTRSCVWNYILDQAPASLQRASK